MVIALGFISCKKENLLAPVGHTYILDYSPLKIGNYWVYEYYDVDTIQGTNQLMDRIDSVFVSGDTTINQKQYFVQKTFSLLPSQIIESANFIRDSSGYSIRSSSVKLPSIP